MPRPVSPGVRPPSQDTAALVVLTGRLVELVPLRSFVAIAQTDGPGQIRALRPRVIAEYGRCGEFQRREDQLRHGRSLSQPYPDDGMAEYRLRLEAAAPDARAVALRGRVPGVAGDVAHASMVVQPWCYRITRGG